MFVLKVLLLCSISMTASLSHAVVRIVCTAALTNAHFEFRKQQYHEAFTILKNFGYSDFYIIEALKKQGPTFLEEYSSHVFYATVNNPHLKNNGINEAKTFLEGCSHFRFDPEDVVVKLTGRYQLISDFLIKTIETNPDVDAFVKVNEDENVFTLGYAMRYKYLREMLESIDYGSLERYMIPIEYRVGDYIKKKKRGGNFKVMYIETLHITGNLYGSSTAPGHPVDIRVW